VCVFELGICEVGGFGMMWVVFFEVGKSEFLEVAMRICVCEGGWNL
jgi:hypothetical protein